MPSNDTPASIHRHTLMARSIRVSSLRREGELLPTKILADLARAGRAAAVRAVAAFASLSTGPRPGKIHLPVPHAVQADRPAQHRACLARAGRDATRGRVA